MAILSYYNFSIDSDLGTNIHERHFNFLIYCFVLNIRDVYLTFLQSVQRFKNANSMEENVKMSAEIPEEPLRRPRFRLFVPGTPKTHKQAAAERLQKVSNPSESTDNPNEDPCEKRGEAQETEVKFKPTVGVDPRFQQQNQTLRCFVMYTDFFRCEKILGEGHEACSWFKQCYQTICPNDWIRHWDDLRSQDLMPWSKAYYKAAQEAERRDSDK
ncbi:uncharacterized protein [Fopius arisanus]|uniref:Uncharacterized protein n=1 Tax=Fopius arisanus TaxID=64838 RepID=A0A9R1T493_9HYME|nr:PREDICTED: uncharacterized protein LOC105266167 [Fopius arisanus]